MLDSLENLSFISGAGLIAVVSIVVAICSLIVRSWRARWVILLLVAVASSYSLYWLPVWRGADPAEYEAWELFGAIWAAVGVASGSAVFAIVWFVTLLSGRNRSRAGA